MTTESLVSYFINNQRGAINKWLHYFDIYEKHLSRFRGNNPVVLEIGVKDGGSLGMWKDYFGQGSKIIGLDINPDCIKHQLKDVEVFIGSQDDPNIINNIFSKYKNIDILIDDGSHRMVDMINSFNLIYNRLNEDGLYIVEDTQTCFDNRYCDANDLTFLDFAREKLDELHYGYVIGGELMQGGGVVNKSLNESMKSASEFTCSTQCISFYSGIVVFERRKQAMRNSCTSQGLTSDRQHMFRTSRITLNS